MIVHSLYYIILWSSNLHGSPQVKTRRPIALLSSLSPLWPSFRTPPRSLLRLWRDLTTFFVLKLRWTVASPHHLLTSSRSGRWIARYPPALKRACWRALFPRHNVSLLSHYSPAGSVRPCFLTPARSLTIQKTWLVHLRLLVHRSLIRGGGIPPMWASLPAVSCGQYRRESGHRTNK